MRIRSLLFEFCWSDWFSWKKLRSFRRPTLSAGSDMWSRQWWMIDICKWSLCWSWWSVQPASPASPAPIISNLFVAGVHFITRRKVRSCCRVFQLGNYQFLHKIPGYQRYVRCEVWRKHWNLERNILFNFPKWEMNKLTESSWLKLTGWEPCVACWVRSTTNISLKFSRKYFNPDKAVILLLTGGEEY